MRTEIEYKLECGVPLSKGELLFLYEEELSYLSYLSDRVRRKINGDKVFYKRNFHLEPSNVCRHRCEFCSYRRESDRDPGAWNMSLEEVENYCRKKYQPGMTEVHIVGSVHPDKNFSYYRDVVKKVRDILPSEVSIKAYSAVEIVDMCQDSINSKRYSIESVLSELKICGLSSIPGGGAEILNDSIRKKICPDKATSLQWLDVHRTAHKLGISSNATMLFGHIESREDRVNHMLKIRDLQNDTHGFDAFIPLKYHTSNNLASQKYNIKEVSTIEILRTFAIARLALYNVPHIKAYWPMLGKEMTSLALLYGADDIDGTVNDSTKIYSLAGAQEQKPTMSVSQLKNIAQSAGYLAVEIKSF